MIEVFLGSTVFVGIVMLLAISVLVARSALMPSKAVTITLNQNRKIIAQAGSKLLSALGDANIAIPSACGGAGTCGQCRVQIIEGIPPAAQTETALLSRRDIADGIRLACQTTLRANIAIVLPDAVLDAKSWDCRVISSRTMAPLIREVVLDLPENAAFTFTPGAFVMVTAPPYHLRFADYDIAPEHQKAWDAMGLDGLTASSKSAESRAYSIATCATEKAGRIVLLIRLALPPPGRATAPPGIVSSWLFGRREGDKVTISGPFGAFAAQDTNREMVFIGGGVGMAPLRAIITDQLERQHTTRKISFWYGARSQIDLFYEEEFDLLERTYPNFSWTAALSEPAPQDNWQGETGFIHDVAMRRGLAAHPAPQDCEYYLCGPPPMIRAVLTMLDGLGVDPDHIFNDAFGG